MIFYAIELIINLNFKEKSMPTLLETLGHVLSNGNTLNQISRQVGTDNKTTGNALAIDLPVLLGALAKNTSNRGGAQSLLGSLMNDHGSRNLNNLEGLIDNPEAASASGILGHVFGGNRSRVESSLGKSTGLDAATIAKLLTVAAPIVMGVLGKERKSRNVDSQGLSNMLNLENMRVQNREPKTRGVLNLLLDTDRDGDVDLGDIARSGLPKLLGGLLSGR